MYTALSAALERQLHRRLKHENPRRSSGVFSPGEARGFFHVYFIAFAKSAFGLPLKQTDEYFLLARRTKTQMLYSPLLTVAVTA